MSLTSGPEAVSTPVINKIVKKILDHAKTFGLVMQMVFFHIGMALGMDVLGC